jgi:hypothetical protein
MVKYKLALSAKVQSVCCKTAPFYEQVNGRDVSTYVLRVHMFVVLP